MSIWWAQGLTQPIPRLPPGQPFVEGRRFTNIYIMPFVGLDFGHNYIGVRSWRRGENLYAELKGDQINGRYTYSPVTLVAFSWTALFPPQGRIMVTIDQRTFPFEVSFVATFVWLAFTIAVTGVAAWRSWATRTEAGLSMLPLLFVFGMTFASYPVIFEMERGNCDALPLLAILLIVAMLRWRQRGWADLGIGFCVAGAVGIKPYAIALLLGLVALRRARAAAFSLGWMAVAGVALWRDFGRWFEVSRTRVDLQEAEYLDYSHSVIRNWSLILRDIGVGGGTSLPPVLWVGAVALLVGLGVSWRVFRARENPPMSWPFLLWLAALATFVSPIANDYNLLFVPLAILAVWSARDSWWLNLCAVPALLWCQPLYIGISGLWWLLIKAGSIVLVGWLIICRVGSSANYSNGSGITGGELD